MSSTQTKKYKTHLGSQPVSPTILDSAFTCPRCQGLFVRVFCMDMYDGTGENGFWALRCLQCGELLDPLILQHRISKPQLVQTKRPRQQSPMALS
jgi:transcription elongation factor Elf1